MLNTIIFEMMSVSVMLRFDFEIFSQISAHDRLFASRDDIMHHSLVLHFYLYYLILWRSRTHLRWVQCGTVGPRK